MPAWGTTIPSARTPSQGWLAKMKTMTLIRVPICISGEAMAEPANAPTYSAFADNMVTSVPRFGVSGAPVVASVT